MAAEDNKNDVALSQLDPDQAKLDLERRRLEEDLKLRREELEIRRKEVARTVWSSPLLLAVIGVLATIIVSLVQSYFQNEANRKLERQRFESALIQKAVETDSPEEAAKRLKFLANLGFITDESGKIANYVKEPETIPLQPITNALASTCTPNLTDLHNCPDEGCGTHLDPDLNKLKNITSNTQTSTVRSLSYIQNLQDPTNFSEGSSRSALASLGEGQMVTVVAYLIAAKAEGAESCNCGLTGPAETDNHLVLVDQSTLNQTTDFRSRESKSTTMEITPRVRWSHPNWTKEKLDPLINAAPNKSLLVRITGPLLFDSEHFLRNRLLRVSNWEVHPILGLEFCPAGKTCVENSNANWKRLDDIP